MPKKIAEQASMQSFLNCYLRETGNYELLPREELYEIKPGLSEVSAVRADHFVVCDLPHHRMEIIAPVKYWSLTDRHLFCFPLYYFSGGSEIPNELDYVTLVTLIIKELSVSRGISSYPDELIFRVIQSCRHIESYVSNRQQEAHALYDTHFDFLGTEQSLIFGHLLHPTPKSRQGLSDIEQSVCSPEQKGSFPLHYFQAHRSIVREQSNLPKKTTQLIKEEILSDPEISESFKKKYCQADETSILPVHPVQAQYLLRKPEIRKLMEEGLLVDLGIQGREYYPTSSLRTLYHPESRFMFKCSVNIKITNSVRLNKYKELERGVEVARILDSEIGKELKERFPDFHIIKDPAFITIAVPGSEESGFELVLRENPFMGENSQNVTLIAGLCQDAMPGYQPRLANLITDLASQEGRTTQEVSEDWFRQYLELSFKPVMWLYLKFGIALEAHQQNSLVQLCEGYPRQFYYRDNQGYYYCESTFPQLKRILPGINEKSQTRCADAVADERLRYYFFINHLLGLINAFGVFGLARESDLLEVLRSFLQQLKPDNREPSALITSLLEEKTLPCKGNLLTRLYDLDELTGPMESQSVYVHIPNPFLKEVRSAHEMATS
ncbi:IucA/IucC family siderophore biosynthesis protein [Paenactinomyces guangxiensis]|uniref:IucA/IucC family siderophore biosynthesis protein n=2 Tax=Paenactinomyces guangxiensis TaxID=1490290 RepID=A0A7W1WU80_9BACL|nr:IucA/IucC family siderophore biosynthesis protein [Paenactinomyces guangxiensis]MBH8593205.1 IucA/IucC family siderophore biosynthesis protein [Paenactinomyces guangxiensis]